MVAFRSPTSWIHTIWTQRTLVDSSCIYCWWFPHLGYSTRVVFANIIWRFYRQSASSVLQPFSWPTVCYCHG
jgi:hypothetical protein